MKKLLVLLLALALTGGFVFAQDLGISPGIHFEFSDLSADDTGIWVAPNVEYAKSFGDLDSWGYFGVWFGLGDGLKTVNNDGDDAIPIGFKFEIEPWYNIALNQASTLSFGLWAGFNFWLPVIDDHSAMDLGIMPMVQYKQGIDGFGNVYGRIEFELDGILEHGRHKDAEMSDEMFMGLYFALGMEHDSGFGAEIKPKLILAPDYFTDDSGYFYSIAPKVWYTFDPIYFEVKADIRVGDYKDFFGIMVKPKLEVNLMDNALKLYAGCEFDRIANDVDADVSIAPFFGVRYNF